MKIAYLSHVVEYYDSFPIATIFKQQIELLKEKGHDLTVFHGNDMPRWHRTKEINEEAKNKLVAFFNEKLQGFDVIVTHDFFIPDCITYRQAITECNVNANWYHWIHSGFGAPVDVPMKKENTTWVYLNKSDLEVCAKYLGVEKEQMACVYPIVEPRFNVIAKRVVNKLKLWEKDIIKTYAFCTTRADAKGINNILEIFASLKKQGKKVGIVFCNANVWQNEDKVEVKKQYAYKLGLTDEDFVFTGDVSNETVRQLQSISNLFIFASKAETCGLVMLEASLGKNLMIVNRDVPAMHEFTEGVIKHSFSKAIQLEPLCDVIIEKLNANQSDKQMRKVWKTHNSEKIYQDIKYLYKI